jgi:8-oxo-dGTP pyrophosphatase MutT (NUDIX family)
MSPQPIYEQSAVVPYRRRAGELEVLLITSIRRGRWIVPKGLVEPDMSPPESAANEAYEEAGVRGRVDPRAIGEYSFSKWGGVCEVQVFLMEVTEVFDHWLESDVRERQWAAAAEALELVEDVALRELIALGIEQLSEES